MCPHCSTSSTFYKTYNPLHMKHCNTRIQLFSYSNGNFIIEGIGKKNNIPIRNQYLCYECNKPVTNSNGKLVRA